MSRQPLQMVANGLTFLFLAALMPIFIGLLGFGLVMFLFFVVQWRALDGDATIFAFLLTFVLAGLAVSSLLGFFGMFLCLAVSPESRGSELVVAALLFQGLGMLLSAFMSASLGWPALAEWIPWMSWTQLAVNGISSLLFFLFLHRLGQYLGRRDVRLRAKLVPTLLLMQLAMAGLATLWVRLAQQHLPDSFDGRFVYESVTVALVAVSGIAALWGYFAFLGLLRRARRACLDASICLTGKGYS